MQKLLRGGIVLLLIMVTVAIVLSQTRLYHDTGLRALIEPSAADEVSRIAASMPPSADMADFGQPARVVVAGPASAPPASALPSTVVFRAADEDVARLAAEREADRAVIAKMEQHVERLTNSSLAQNYLMLFSAIIYFVTLIVIFLLYETVKKFADAAAKSAEAARLSAETAKLALQGKDSGTF